MNKYLGITLAAVIGGIIVLLGASQLGWGETRYVRPANEPVVQFSNLTDPADRDDVIPASGFTVAAEQALPAVVHIKSATRVSSTNGQGGRMPDMFRDFFGPGFDDQLEDPGQGPLQEGSGSGVIISPDGFIVTNNHVVEGAETLEVILNDQSTYEAEIIGTDETTDVALIKINADEDLPMVQFANSDELRIGEWVVAVGNP